MATRRLNAILFLSLAIGPALKAQDLQPPASDVALTVHRWAEDAEGCALRIVDGTQLKTIVTGDLELSVALASGHRQYWIYLAVTNRGARRIAIRPSAFQLLSMEPYQRQMLFRPVEAILSAAKELANGDAAYSGPPITLAPASTVHMSPDYAAMDRAYRLVETAPSDATELACHLESRLLAANSIEPGSRSAGFVLFETPAPLKLRHGRSESRWDPVALMLSIRVGSKYLQVPLEVER